MIVPADFVAAARLQSHGCGLGAFSHAIGFRLECNCGRGLTRRNCHLVGRAAESVIGAVGSVAAHGITDSDRLSDCR